MVVVIEMVVVWCIGDTGRGDSSGSSGVLEWW